MSVSAISGVSSHLYAPAVQLTTRPEAAEVSGQPDHDGDGDDRSVSSASSAKVNLYA